MKECVCFEDSSHSSHSILGIGGASLLHRDVLSCILRGEGQRYSGRVGQESSLHTKQGLGHVLPHSNEERHHDRRFHLPLILRRKSVHFCLSFLC